MIRKFRNSFFGKLMSTFMLYIFVQSLFFPYQAFALTGGPAQPEFNAFTPIGVSDMVDLSSGDFTYNIPLMDVGGFPVNLAYNSGVTMDQEASWVGLGWNLSIGQINRQMRGIPDDFDGDEMTYVNDMKDNFTVGAAFNFNPALVGIDGIANTNDDPGLTFNVGISAQYNSYNGVSMSPSAGLSYELSDNASIGLNVKSDENGLTVSPNLSLHSKKNSSMFRDNKVGANVGVSFNSRQGLSSVNMSASRSSVTELGAKNFKLQNSGSIGSSISFVDNYYTPTVQSNLTSVNFTFNAALGMEIYGVEGQGQITGFGSNQYIPDNKNTQVIPAFGYDNNHKASENDVRDFNREKDGNFSVNSTNLPLTNYTYDIYSIQGQGVAGMFRPYRSQVGYVADNKVYNSGGGLSAGAEFGGGNAFHLGVDVEVNVSSSESGVWSANDGNNAIDNFESANPTNPLYEEVYYKNVGDLAVDTESDMYGTNSTKLGEYSPIRLKLEGPDYERTVAPTYQIKHPNTPSAFIDQSFSSNDIKRSERLSRNQHILKVRNDEITNQDGTLLGFTSNTNAQPHHTAGFIITRDDGARYIYGEALYNKSKSEVTFAAEGLTPNCATGQVTFSGTDNTVNNTRGDQYFNKVTTGPYAHTFLLTCIASTDYSDISGDGPTADDLGSYTIFRYSDAANYGWRVPYGSNKANFNEGIKTDPSDDKASYVEGTKEMKFIEEIETKTHIAIFHTSSRADGLGAGSGTMKRLDKISLYSVGEYYLPNGSVNTSAVPIKEVHFVYDYSLCDGIDNGSSGKLTLTSLYFTYRDSYMGKYSDYKFTYGDVYHDGSVIVNPDYNLKSYDIWGNYKDNSSAGCTVLGNISVPEFNYVEQANDDLQALNERVAAWSLTDIELPSGGKIKIDYEADDYQYVQDKEAMEMFKVVGAGDVADPATEYPSWLPNTTNNNNALLYKTDDENNAADYIYVHLADESTGYTAGEFKNEYLKEIATDYKNLVQFRFMMNMNPEGGKNSGWTGGYFDYVTGYFELDYAGCNVFEKSGEVYGAIKLKLVNMEGGVAGALDVNPIAKAGWNFGRKYVPNYIYGLPDQNGSGTESELLNMVLQTADNLLEIFAGPNGVLATKNIARRFIPQKSWVRLMTHDGVKKGGGSRVAKIIITDEWAEMTKDENGGIPETERDQFYGQEYDYTLDNGTSSGVATYEPIGCKENPIIQPVYVNKKRLLAPDEENYTELPFGESFYPSSKVTYSKVTVRNLSRYDDNGTVGNTTDDKHVLEHATGKVVTEFYTSKDYPTITDQTELLVHEDKPGPLANLLNLFVKKHITLTQGYVVHINDMDGKKKSERVYAEGQTDYISGVDYIYDGYTATGTTNPFDLMVYNEGKINNDVLTLSPNGQIETNTLGVEYDIINDFRQMSSETEIIGINANVATFLIGFIPGIIPVPLPDFAHHEDQLSMTTTTKIINTFGVLRETVAHDAGASVSTRNLLWDSETGDVLLTETVNEYGDKYYSMNFPAYWYYDGMGMACDNGGMSFPFGAAGSYYQIYASQPENQLLNPGDEVLIFTGSIKEYAWVDNVTSTGFTLMDETGAPLSVSTAYPPYGFMVGKVMRSGKRNMQRTSMASVVMMENPIDGISQLPPTFLESTTPNQNKIINAGAVEFGEDWNLQCECGTDNTDPNFNPWLYNTKGVWRAITSYLYLSGRSQDATEPDLRNDGFYNHFSPFYYIDGSGNWHIDKTDWTFTSEVSEYSPYGFELENKDALDRYSAALYGYNFSFPLAVGANTKYTELAFDGFEDYVGFDGCVTNEHFGLRDLLDNDNKVVVTFSHTGNYSLKIVAGDVLERIYHLDCP